MSLTNFFMELYALIGLGLSIKGAIAIAGSAMSNEQILRLSSRVDFGRVSQIVRRNEEVRVVNSELLEEYQKTRGNLFVGMALLMTGFVFQLIPTTIRFAEATFNTEFALGNFFISSIFLLSLNLLILKKMKTKLKKTSSEPDGYERIR